MTETATTQQHQERAKTGYRHDFTETAFALWLSTGTTATALCGAVIYPARNRDCVTQFSPLPPCPHCKNAASTPTS